MYTDGEQARGSSLALHSLLCVAYARIVLLWAFFAFGFTLAARAQEDHTLPWPAQDGFYPAHELRCRGWGEGPGLIKRDQDHVLCSTADTNGFIYAYLSASRKIIAFDNTGNWTNDIQLAANHLDPVGLRAHEGGVMALMPDGNVEKYHARSGVHADVFQALTPDPPIHWDMSGDEILYILTKKSVFSYRATGELIGSWPHGQLQNQYELTDTPQYIFCVNNDEVAIVYWQNDSQYLTRYYSKSGELLKTCVFSDPNLSYADPQYRIESIALSKDGNFFAPWTRLRDDLNINFRIMNVTEGVFMFTPLGVYNEREVLAHTVWPSSGKQFGPVDTCIIDNHSRLVLWVQSADRPLLGVIFERDAQSFVSKPAGRRPLVRMDGARQRPGTRIMDIDFEVMDDDSTNLHIAAVAWLPGRAGPWPDSQITQAKGTFSYAVKVITLIDGTDQNMGFGKTPGKKRISWDVGADLSTNKVELTVEILVNDGRDLIPFHLVTIPRENGQDPLVISRDPVLSPALFEAYLWLVASHDPSVLLQNGNIIGTSGIYQGVNLVLGKSVTNEGKAFILNRQGLRAATAPEIAFSVGLLERFNPIDSRLRFANDYYAIDYGGTPTRNEYGFPYVHFEGWIGGRHSVWPANYIFAVPLSP